MAQAYKENKIDFRSFARRTAVDILIPNHENDNRRARFTIASGVSRRNFQIKDEDDYAKHYLSTQGSIYFRQRRVYPRTFLWRVADDNTVLEIQAADLTRSLHDQQEASLQLRLEFQDGIIPSGIALADSEDHEVLNIFVLTKTNRLYTLSLRPEFFRRAASIDENITDWCRSCVPAPLTFAHPHRLHASSTTELFIALDSGALLRLTRRAGDDGKTILYSFCRWP
jgi:nuclear pore complex protein Nup160